jgi:hypothetical protein
MAASPRTTTIQSQSVPALGMVVTNPLHHPRHLSHYIYPAAGALTETWAAPYPAQATSAAKAHDGGGSRLATAQPP